MPILEQDLGGGFSIREVGEYPLGPRDEADAIAAAKEVDCAGLLTGGPRDPLEWAHWNAAVISGWPGRYPPRCPAVTIYIDNGEEK